MRTIQRYQCRIISGQSCLSTSDQFVQTSTFKIPYVREPNVNSRIIHRCIIHVHACTNYTCAVCRLLYRLLQHINILYGTCIFTCIFALYCVLQGLRLSQLITLNQAAGIFNIFIATKTYRVSHRRFKFVHINFTVLLSCFCCN